MIIGGEPGVGKTRLTEEVADEARALGFRAFRGHCYRTEGDLPYMPWVEVIEAALEVVPPETMRQALAHAAPELARIVPQLRRLFSDLPPPIDMPPEEQRRHIFSSITEYVGRAAISRPHLYVLEDLHWADRATLLFLAHLVERLPGMPVVIVGTYRDPPVDVSPALSDALAELARRPNACLLSIRRHSEAEVAQLLHGLSGNEAPAGIAATIYAETEGNAFFVEEVFCHLAESGRLLDDHGGFRADLRLAELDVPQNVRLVTAQRVDRLSEDTRQMLIWGAVTGRHFSLELAETIGTVTGDSLLDAVDEAERARLISTEALPAETRVWFTHELIRQTLLMNLSSPRRMRLHLRVAEALQVLHSGDVDSHSADIAHHLVEAGPAADPALTVRYARQAGDGAMAQLAFENATSWYEQAIHHLALLNRAEHSGDRCRLLLSLGDSQARAGDVRASTTYLAAADLARDERDHASFARAALGVADVWAWTGTFDRVRIDLLEEALALLDHDMPLRAQLLGRLATELYFVPGSLERRDSLSAESVETARRVGDPLGLAMCLHARNHAVWGPGDAGRCVAVGREIVLLAEQGAHPELALQGHAWCMTGLLELGDIGGLDSELDVYCRLAEELRQPRYIWYAWTRRAMRALLRGDLDTGERLATQALEMGRGSASIHRRTIDDGVMPTA